MLAGPVEVVVPFPQEPVIYFTDMVEILARPICSKGKLGGARILAPKRLAPAQPPFA